MASAGLSLVGFLDQNEALAHLKSVCVPTIQDDAILSAEWVQAKASLGSAIPNAGKPEIIDLPAQADDYLKLLTSQEWLVAHQSGTLAGVEFKLIEIDPLLAFQQIIDVTRSNFHCGNIGQNPPTDKILELCLPLQPQQEQIQTSHGPQSIILTTKSLNLQLQAQGMFNGQFMGVTFGLSLPFVHVVEFQGRYFLHNGFHRALGLRASGVTHLPCILRHVNDYDAVGLRLGTFQPTLLESENPPTVGHYTQGRAHSVSLRAVQRVLHVSWSEYVVPIE
jgi:hypothetical protein